MKHPRRLGILIVALLIGLSIGLPAQTGGSREKILISASKPYAPIVARVQALGGTVTHQYKYIDAVAAVLPLNGLTALRDLLGPGAISKDLDIELPGSVDTIGSKQVPATPQEPEALADAADVVGDQDLATLAGSNPQAYLLNNAIANVTPLHAGGITGLGVIVAVIDTGIRPGFPHISLDGSVVGCEDFVGDALGCSNSGNNFHGTFVAGMISANVVFTFSAASSFRNAVLAECPACFLNPPINTQIPMIGTAPRSSLYALRVFGATGGAPTSRILAAMERAIDLREAYNTNHSTGANITIANMSLGGSTIFAGRDLFDQMVDVMLSHDIMPVISAGNAGQASLTVGSPGSAIGALTVGAASLAHNERILRRLQFGPTIGSLYRPFLGHQTAFFSSRGPNADGRPDPDVVMNGFACYGQGSGSTSTITLASGTSFSAPSTAGVAALLRQAYPSSTGRQIRNAIIASANPTILSDGSTVLDQGAGYVNAAAAASLLAGGLVPDALPTPPKFTKNVNVNIEQNTFLQVRQDSVFESATNLKPGQRHEVVYQVAPNTRQVTVFLTNVAPALPPAEQNQLFGDDILLSVHTAKTSAIGEGDYPVFAFSTGGTFAVNNPETGLMRVTVGGDWTNAGLISADVAILSTVEAIPQLSTQGTIADQQLIAFPVTIPSGVSRAEFRLGWREDWGRYPSADIDLILVKPNGVVSFAGATLNNPEVAAVTNPIAGNWTVLVQGFEIHTITDKFDLRVSLDGKVVKIK
jgi:subtilisin family serine protease